MANMIIDSPNPEAAKLGSAIESSQTVEIADMQKLLARL
jgi:uncharacterized protein (DUF305 family)